MFDLIPMSGHERSIWNYFDNLERNFFQNAFPSFATGDVQPRTDVTDEGDRYLLSAEFPGFNREDINIGLDGNMLTISATRKEENEEKKDNYIRRERRMGAYSRSFDISGIDTEAINAKYENGVLKLELPKKQATPLPPARQIEIQ